jgi:signal transduction histidine kinase
MDIKFSAKKRTVETTLWLIIVASMIFHFVLLLLGNTLLMNWQWKEEAAHTAIEISGSVIALFVALFLLYYQRFGRGTHYNIPIAMALIVMGIMDGFHAVVGIGDTFVWLHSIATFLGGFLLALIYIPERCFTFKSQLWLPSIAVLSCLICLAYVVFPELVPVMMLGSEFTDLAVMLNQVGGGLFFLAAVKLILAYQKSKRVDDLLFFLHCFLFGAAAIMFQQSSLWDAPWWGWHILRLIAYATALWFIMRMEVKVLDELDNHLVTLEQAVSERTLQLRQSNDQLQDSLCNMKYTQARLEEREQQTVLAQLATQRSLDELILAKDSLVQAEKMASLGQLVAGVAHEVNTPIGICITANSAIKEETIALSKAIESKALSKSQLANTLALQTKYQEIIDGSLNKAADLIQSFRAVAVEKNTDLMLDINLSAHLNEVIDMIKIMFREKNYHIELNLDDKLRLRTYPGAWHQIFTNLLMNSHIHGFDGCQDGNIIIDITTCDEHLNINYQDDGIGIEQDIKARIFDPFVTTKRGQGNSGLGLHIVFNLVSVKLNGTITCLKNKSDSGCHFRMKVPLVR